MFDADLVQAGPQAQESTNDPLVALLWTAQGIEAKLVEIINELKAQQPTNEHPIETWRRQLGQTEWDRILDHTSAQRVRELIRLMDEGEEE